MLIYAFKMRIAKDDDQCSLCQGGLDTLGQWAYIFIQFYHIQTLSKIDSTHLEKNRYEILTKTQKLGRIDRG